MAWKQTKHRQVKVSQEIETYLTLTNIDMSDGKHLIFRWDEFESREEYMDGGATYEDGSVLIRIGPDPVPSQPAVDPIPPVVDGSGMVVKQGFPGREASVALPSVGELLAKPLSKPANTVGEAIDQLKAVIYQTFAEQPAFKDSREA